MVNNIIKVKILDFTENPGPRYVKQDAPESQNSGEAFYVYKLNAIFAQAVKENKRIVLELDGVSGYPSSFLDEAIGELVYDFTLDVVKNHLEFESKMYCRRINQVKEETYLQWEKRRIDKEEVSHSQNLNHDIFYLDNNRSIATKHLS